MIIIYIIFSKKSTKMFYFLIKLFLYVTLVKLVGSHCRILASSPSRILASSHPRPLALSHPRPLAPSPTPAARSIYKEYTPLGVSQRRNRSACILTAILRIGVNDQKYLRDYRAILHFAVLWCLSHFHVSSSSLLVINSLR